MKSITFFLFIPFFTQAQDSLTFRAQVSNYYPTPVFGLTTNGHLYTIGFKMHTGTEMEAIRVDMTAKTTSAKTLTGTFSSSTFYWRNVLHTTGVYYGLNSGNRKVILLNMKDSIYYYNFGSCFLNGTNLAYSMSTGRDGNIYLGGSSPNVQVSYINTVTKEVVMYNAVDNQEYCLSINGDNDWMYAQTGQDVYNFTAIRKSDGYKKQLYSVASLLNQGTTDVGVFVQAPSQSMKRVTDTTLITQAYSGTSTELVEVTGVTGHFNDVASRYSWQQNSDTTSMEVPNSWEDNNIRRIYPDLYNDSLVHYFGDLYGIAYTHNRYTNVTTPLGHIGFNIFDAKQVDSLHWIFVGYPSSWTAVWDRSQPWTAETFLHPLSASTNPRSRGTGRATSDVHEPTQILDLGAGKFIYGGNEIRTGTSAGINVFDYNTGVITGFKGLLDNQYYGSIAKRHDGAILATNNAGVNGKIYFLNTVPAIVDSINTGFKNNGTAFCVNDRIYIIAQDTSDPTQTIDSAIFAVFNANTKERIYYKKMRGLALAVQWMPDAKIGINFKLRTGPGQGLTDAPLPEGFFALRRVDNRTYTYDNAGKYYSVNGIYPLQYNGITSQELDMSTATGVNQYLIREYR